MAYDYSGDLEFAQTIIAEFGSSHTFTRLDEVLDINDPLAENVGASVTVTMPGVSLEVIGNEFGRYVDVRDMIKTYDKVVLFPGYAAADIETFNFVTDADGVVWMIGDVMSFKPADVSLLHFVGLKK